MAQNCERAVCIGTSAGRDDHAGVSTRHDGVVRGVVTSVWASGQMAVAGRGQSDPMTAECSRAERGCGEW
jgi:hypothetical protein